MKFTVSSERKCQAAKQYESFSVFVSLEGDTGVEPIEITFQRAHEIVDAEVKRRKAELADEYQKELDAGERH